jgi:hypothetical protein
MVARKNSYTTATDNQVVEAQIGTIGTWIFPSNAGIDIWVRMKTTGTPGDDVRVHHPTPGSSCRRSTAVWKRYFGYGRC